MFHIAALNDLDIKMCDIVTSYLNVGTRKRLPLTSESEWGKQKGCQVIPIRALYGLKSGGE